MHVRHALRATLVAAILLGLTFVSCKETCAVDIDFSIDIKPILANHCFSCHGPDQHSRQADLRLDLREQAIAASAIVPHEPDASPVVQRIASQDPDLLMPPPESKKPLTEREKELLREWIKQGANYSQHWAFRPPVNGTLPETKLANWAVNSIDHFVAERFQRENLEPAPAANRETLLRRVTLDLTGLPPTVSELTEFLNDTTEDAYEKVVDRLLGSKPYAERMALEWLDMARYADTNGYNNDEDRTMWPWRDWVIQAFDRNMPYDQFVIEQLAGDLLPNATREQQIASAFLRNQGHNTEGGIIVEEYRVEYVADRVHTAATAFLGLSMQCARCHDHKFDPISQAEYYQFFAYFNSLDEKQAGYSSFVGAEPFIRVPNSDQEAKIKQLEEHSVALEQQIADREKHADENLQSWLSEHSAEDLHRRFGVSQLHHFAFDSSDSIGLRDAVSSTNVGLISGEPKWQVGKRQQAIEISPETKLELGSIADWNGEQPFSISVWVKPTTSDAMAIVSKMDESANFRGYDLLLSGGKVEMHLVHQWPENAIKVSTKQSISANEWHQIVATYDGSRSAAGVKIYVDSKLEAHDVLHDALRDSIQNTMPFRIGLREKSLPYTGLLDDLQIFGSVLETDQVKQLFEGLAFSSFPDWISTPIAERSDEQTKAIRQFFLNRIDTPFQDLQKNLAIVKKERADLENQSAAVMVMREMETPRETFILKRGQYDQPADRVTAGVPAVLLQGEAEQPKDRLELARWLVSDRNPLTARVTVNRWWQNYFGVGLVNSVEDFGVTGTPPSHPELLDHLAIGLVESGWNVKAFQKQVVMSATYRQDSRMNPILLERDPENKLLARGARFRLSAETIRDNALAISGLLKQKTGGPSVKPYQPAGLWEDVTVERRGKYVEDEGEGLYRRSLYTFWKRTCPPPSMMSFDAPNREVCLARRARTNTPLQSLVLLNDPTYIECSRLLAQEMLRAGGASTSDRVDAGFLRCLARRATVQEQGIMNEILEAATKKYHADPSSSRELIGIGATVADGSLDPTELASWTIVASTLLNLDETITKR